MAALKHGSRKFYDIPSEELSNVRSKYSREKERNIEELLNYIDRSCIGKDVMFSGPFGARKGELGEHFATRITCNLVVKLKYLISLSFTVTYCDYTASGRYEYGI